jgi:hypothetical protein
MGTQATHDTPPTPVLRAMDIRAIRETLVTPVLRATDIQVTRDSQLTPAHRTMDTRADRCTLPIPVPDIPWLAIPAIAPRKSGLLGPSTLLSLLAEFRSICSSGTGLTAVSAL